MRTIQVLLLYSSTLLTFRAGAYDLRDITDSVFGSDGNSFLPAAFGDFNSDKLTDIIVLKKDRKSVAVLLASEQNVVSLDSGPMFQEQSTMECHCPDGEFQALNLVIVITNLSSGCTFSSVAPADFDGDGSMDLMTIATGSDGEMKAFVMWGEGHGLECQKNLVTIENITSEPMVFDYNSDFISDLLTVDETGERKVYVFSQDRTFSEASLGPGDGSQLKAEHGNSYVDVTGDGRADLLLTTQKGLELHKGEAGGFQYLCSVPWPVFSSGCNCDDCIGQPAFLDFSLSGSLDLVLPVCFDYHCQNSSLYLIPVSELAACPPDWHWRPMSLDLTPDRRFRKRNPSQSPLALMTPRVGDVDLDGFPDLLMTVYNTSSGAGSEVQLLLNVPCQPMSGCHQSDPTSKYWRQFQLQPGYTAGVGSAVTGAFFDIYEDGRLDLIIVSQDQHDNYLVSAYVNPTQDSDAYFMKVIVLTGACYHNCDHQTTEYVPYGTNSGGQLVSYRSQRPGQESFDSYQSVAVQLPQSSYFALGLPYTIFGLGMAPNFVDSLSVNISAQSHDWPQIIPNSQLYVIPYPPDKPDSWDVKLIITASKNILITGLALVGTCAMCTVIIVLLHIRDKKMDHRAKLQDASRFHFDAM